MKPHCIWYNMCPDNCTRSLNITWILFSLSYSFDNHLTLTFNLFIQQTSNTSYVLYTNLDMDTHHITKQEKKKSCTFTYIRTLWLGSLGNHYTKAILHPKFNSVYVFTHLYMPHCSLSFLILKLTYIWTGSSVVENLLSGIHGSKVLCQ